MSTLRLTKRRSRRTSSSACSARATHTAAAKRARARPFASTILPSTSPSPSTWDICSTRRSARRSTASTARSGTTSSASIIWAIGALSSANLSSRSRSGATARRSSKKACADFLIYMSNSTRRRKNAPSSKTRRGRGSRRSRTATTRLSVCSSGSKTSR